MSKESVVGARQGSVPVPCGCADRPWFRKRLDQRFSRWPRPKVVRDMKILCETSKRPEEWKLFKCRLLNANTIYQDSEPRLSFYLFTKSFAVLPFHSPRPSWGEVAAKDMEMMEKWEISSSRLFLMASPPFRHSSMPICRPPSWRKAMQTLCHLPYWWVDSMWQGRELISGITLGSTTTRMFVCPRMQKIKRNLLSDHNFHQEVAEEKKEQTASKLWITISRGRSEGIFESFSLPWLSSLAYDIKSGWILSGFDVKKISSSMFVQVAVPLETCWVYVGN